MQMLRKTSSHPPPSFVDSSLDESPPDLESRKRRASPLACPWRRRSSERKLQRVLNALAPFRLRGSRRSHSVDDLTNNRKELFAQAQRRQASDESGEPPKSPASGFPGDAVSLTVPIVPRYYCPAAAAAVLEDDLTNLPPLLAAHVYRLDHDLAEPDIGLNELRRRWPRTFTNLIANYLSFLDFQADDLFRIADEVGCQEFTRMSARGTASPMTRSIFTPIRRTNIMSILSSGRAPREDISHWYTVVNAMIKYLIEENRYRQKFIFRRPGIQTHVNELERLLFSQKIMGCSDDSRPSAESPLAVSTVGRVTGLLVGFDSITVASTLSRVLRRHGPLIPSRLHCLFSQLTVPAGPASDTVSEASDVFAARTHTSPSVFHLQSYRRRALRLLLQLTPSRHLNLVYRPLCHLFACIAADPACEVDETSLAVLFAPVFMLDRESATPSTMVNPQLPQIVKLLIALAQRELSAADVGTAPLFRVPRLFVHDCHRNLAAHMESEDPPLYCSLRYCTTISTRQNSMAQIPVPVHQRSVSTETLTTALKIDPVGATNDRQRPITMPLIEPTTSANLPGTPIIKRPLHSSVLNFRVRRTPFKISREKLQALQPLTPLS
uniref:RhoGAP domain n=1 Tax=Schistocephalus solidus TaxID=70667 RepID=A0A0V0JBU3_SCHSO